MMARHVLLLLVALGLALAFRAPRAAGGAEETMKEAVEILRRYAAARAAGHTGADVDALLARADETIARAEAQMEPTDPLRKRVENLRVVVSIPLDPPGPRYRDATLRYVFGAHADAALYAPFYDRGRLLPHASSQLVDKHMFLYNRTRVLIECVRPVCPPLRGRRVADVGCGVGAFLPFLLDEVGPEGVVWAEDIEPTAIDFIRAVGDYGLEDFRRVRAVVGTIDDPGLPRGGLDVVFLNNMPALRARPAHRQQSLAFLAQVHAMLDRGGALVAVMKVIRRNELEAAGRLLAEAGFKVVARATNLEAPSHEYFALRATRLDEVPLAASPAPTGTPAPGFVAHSRQLLRNLRTRPKKRDKFLAAVHKQMEADGLEGVDRRMEAVETVFDRALSLSRGEYREEEDALARRLDALLDNEEE